MTLNFESKVLELKEKEASKDFIISKIQRELEMALHDHQIYVARNDQTTSLLRQEIERLRKFANVRQQETHQER